MIALKSIPFAIIVLTLGLFSEERSFAAERSSIVVPSVLVRLVEQVEIPAREPGLLTQMAAVEGQMVREGQLLAQIDDQEARLIQRRMQLELELGRQKNENDVAIRMASKSLEVARAELKRAEDSAKQFPKSVSESELDFLRLSVERGELEIEQARHELDLATAALQLKENDIAQARGRVERLRITAPIDGVVAQVVRRRGEWVEPGMMVIRVLRLDRLRAEGFLRADQFTDDLNGRSVTLVLDKGNTDKGNTEGARRRFKGHIVFVSPEIDPVNGQVRIWAEIDNRQLHLRPGMRGTMTIEPRAALKKDVATD